MTCQPIKLPGGGTAIVCGSKPRQSSEPPAPKWTVEKSFALLEKIKIAGSLPLLQLYGEQAKTWAILPEHRDLMRDAYRKRLTELRKEAHQCNVPQ